MENDLKKEKPKEENFDDLYGHYLPNFNNQIEKLEGIGMTFSDKQRANHFFNSVPFHRFLAYIEPFLNENRRCENIDFLTISKIYGFDRKLRNLILSCVEEIELFLRSQFAFYHCSHYGKYGYLKEENFEQGCNIGFFKRAIYDNLEDKGIDYRDVQNIPKLPIWEVLESLTVGNLQYFYSNMKKEDKTELALKLYTTTFENVENWLDCFTELRNRTAHYSRLYHSYFPFTPTLPKNIKHIPKGSLFDMMFCLKLLYNSNERFNRKFLVDLEKLIDSYSKIIKLEHMGFPINWKELLKNDYLK